MTPKNAKTFWHKTCWLESALVDVNGYQVVCETYMAGVARALNVPVVITSFDGEAATSECSRVAAFLRTWADALEGKEY